MIKSIYFPLAARSPTPDWPRHANWRANMTPTSSPWSASVP